MVLKNTCSFSGQSELVCVGFLKIRRKAAMMELLMAAVDVKQVFQKNKSVGTLAGISENNRLLTKEKRLG